MLIVGAAVATVIVVRPLWGFYILLCSIPAQDLGAVGGLTATNVIFGLTLIAWLLRRLVYGGKPLPRTAIGPIFAIFVGGLALSLTAAQEIDPGIAALFQWVKATRHLFPCARFPPHPTPDDRRAGGCRRRARRGHGRLGAIPDRHRPGEFRDRRAIFARVRHLRATEFYAGYLEMLFPIGFAVCYLVYSRRAAPETTRRRFQLQFAFALGATGMIGAALFASYSRGAWLGTLGALAVMILCYGVRTRVAAVLGVGLLTLLLLAGGANFLPAGFSDRLLNAFANVETPDVRTAFITPENFSTVERLAHWEAGLAMFADNRFLGVGLGNFNVRFSEYTVSPTFLPQGHAHNYYIHVAAEAGLGRADDLPAPPRDDRRDRPAGALDNEPTRRGPFARMIVIACLAVITAVAIHNFSRICTFLVWGCN